MTAFLTRDATLRRLRRGDVLRMEIVDAAGGRRWWFESPLAYVSPNVVASLTAGHRPQVRLVEGGDSLFHLPFNSQTYLAARGGEQ